MSISRKKEIASTRRKPNITSDSCPNFCAGGEKAEESHLLLYVKEGRIRDRRSGLQVDAERCKYVAFGHCVSTVGAVAGSPIQAVPKSLKREVR